MGPCSGKESRDSPRSYSGLVGPSLSLTKIISGETNSEIKKSGFICGTEEKGRERIRKSE